MRAALVAGHLCVDLIPELSAVPSIRPGELVEVGPLELNPGGCVANTGGTLAALGVPVTVVGDVGDDELGTTLVRMLTTRGTRTDRIRFLPGLSTSYSMVLQPPGHDRSFWHHVGANAQFDGSAVDLAGVDLLHVGYPSLLPALAASRGAALAALFTRARAAGVTTSLDLAVLDTRSPSAREDWPALLARVLPLVDVITPSIDDLRSTLHLPAGNDPDSVLRAAQRLLDMGAAIAMVTAGPQGMHLSSAGPERLANAGALFRDDPERRAQWSRRQHFEAAAPAEVRSTVGAGDAASAGLLCGLLGDLAPEPSLHLAATTAAARVSGTLGWRGGTRGGIAVRSLE